MNLLILANLPDTQLRTVYDIHNFRVEPISTIPLICALLGIALFWYGKRSGRLKPPVRKWLNLPFFMKLIGGLIGSVAGLVFLVINIFAGVQKHQLREQYKKGNFYMIKGVVNDFEHHEHGDHFTVNKFFFYIDPYGRGAYSRPLFPDKALHNGAYVHITYVNSTYLKTDDTHDIVILKVAE